MTFWVTCPSHKIKPAEKLLGILCIYYTSKYHKTCFIKMQTWKKNILNFLCNIVLTDDFKREGIKKTSYLHFYFVAGFKFLQSIKFFMRPEFLIWFSVSIFWDDNLKKYYQKKDSKIVNTTAKTDPSTEYKSECSEKNSQYLVKCCLYFGAESCKLKLVRIGWIGWKTVGFSSSADLSPDENFPAKVRFQNIWHCVTDTVPKQENPPFSSGQN